MYSWTMSSKLTFATLDVGCELLGTLVITCWWTGTDEGLDPLISWAKWNAMSWADHSSKKSGSVKTVCCHLMVCHGSFWRSKGSDRFGKLHSWTDIKSNQVKSIQTSKVLTVWRSYQKADRIATANFFCHVVAILWTILGRHNDWNWLDSIGGSWPLKADGIFGYTVNSQLGFAYHLINSLFVALTAP